MKAFMGVALALFGSAQAQTAIYDTFNEAQPEILFDCCNILPIHTKHYGDGRSVIAVPFSPVADGRVTEIDVALSTIQDTDNNGVKIEVLGSQNGLPGRLKHAWVYRGAPDAGQCCVFVSETATGIPVKAGGHYWIAVKAIYLANDGWNLNTIGASGPYAVMGPLGWSMTEGPLPAVRVIAK